LKIKNSILLEYQLHTIPNEAIVNSCFIKKKAFLKFEILEVLFFKMP